MFEFRLGQAETTESGSVLSRGGSCPNGRGLQHTRSGKTSDKPTVACWVFLGGLDDYQEQLAFEPSRRASKMHVSWGLGLGRLGGVSAGLLVLIFIYSVQAIH